MKRAIKIYCETNIAFLRSFDGIHTRIESLGHTLGNIAEKLKSFAKRDEDVEKILKLAKEQQVFLQVYYCHFMRHLFLSDRAFPSN
jgi:hypothetical protein